MATEIYNSDYEKGLRVAYCPISSNCPCLASPMLVLATLAPLHPGARGPEKKSEQGP